MPRASQSQRKHSGSGKKVRSKKCGCKPIKECCPGPVGPGLANIAVVDCGLIATFTTGQVVNLGNVCGPTGSVGPTGILPDLDVVTGVAFVCGPPTLDITTTNLSTGTTGTTSVALFAGCPVLNGVTSDLGGCELIFSFTDGTTAIVPIGCSGSPLPGVLFAVNIVDTSAIGGVTAGACINPFADSVPDFDTAGGYTATGCYTIPISGIYRVHDELSFEVVGATSNVNVSLALRLNGGAPIDIQVFEQVGAGVSGQIFGGELDNEILRCFVAGDVICPQFCNNGEGLATLLNNSLHFDIQGVASGPCTIP